MTYENCKIYMEQAKKAGDKEKAEFWEARIKRKYPDKVEVKTPKPKKEKKVDGDN